MTSEEDESEESEDEGLSRSSMKRFRRRRGRAWKEEEDYEEGLWLEEDEGLTLESYNLSETQFVIEFKKTPRKKRMVLIDGFGNSVIACCRIEHKTNSSDPLSRRHRRNRRPCSHTAYKVVTFHDKCTVAALLEQLKSEFGLSAGRRTTGQDGNRQDADQKEEGEDEWDLYLRRGSTGKAAWLPDGQQKLGSLDIAWAVRPHKILHPAYLCADHVACRIA